MTSENDQERGWVAIIEKKSRLAQIEKDLRSIRKSDRRTRQMLDQTHIDLKEKAALNYRIQLLKRQRDRLIEEKAKLVGLLFAQLWD